jgi:hypothetical protein
MKRREKNGMKRKGKEGKGNERKGKERKGTGTGSEVIWAISFLDLARTHRNVLTFMFFLCSFYWRIPKCSNSSASGGGAGYH